MMGNLALGGFEGRLFFALLFSFGLSISLTDRQIKSRNDSLMSGVIFDSWDLPVSMLILLVLSVLLDGFKNTVEIIIPSFISLSLYIGFYYAVLILFVKPVRKFVSSASSTVLWQIPNYIYLAFFAYSLFEKPLFALKISRSFARVLPWIYAAGFFSLLLFKIVSHLKFRKEILDNSVLIEDETVLDVWEKAKEETGLGGLNIKLYVSQKITTPVSVGLFKRNVFTALPNKQYSDDELELIFLHELIHVSRKDGWNKFFIVFCQALCWFNPLMYIAMKNCSEDMEMSCDELTVRGENSAKRKAYAELILSASGDERGFSSCLSASAKSLKSRLHNVLNPKKKYLGASLASLVLFSMIMVCGSFTLAFEKGTVKDYIYKEEGKFLNNVSVYDKNSEPSERYMMYSLDSAEGLQEYLSSLSLYKYADLYQYNKREIEYKFAFDYYDGSRLLKITLSDGLLHIKYPEGSALAGEYLVFDEEIDKAEIMGYLTPLNRKISEF